MDKILDEGHALGGMHHFRMELKAIAPSATILNGRKVRIFSRGHRFEAGRQLSQLVTV